MKQLVSPLVVGLAVCLLIGNVPAGETSKAKPDGKKVSAAASQNASKGKQEKAAKPAAKAEKKPAAKAEEKAAEKKPAATYTVEPEAFHVEVKLDGVFEARSMHEVILRPESWSTFKVLKAVKHGAQVRKGDVLVEFDAKQIDEAVADQKTAQTLAKLSLKQAEIGLKIAEASLPLDSKEAERQRRMMEEDLTEYLRVGKKMRQKSAQQSLKYAQNSLEYQLEELRQLEKMYKADDITEETEEIVLKRQRDTVERARNYLEQAKVRFDESMKFDIPRSEESMKAASEAIKLTTEQAKTTLPLKLDQQRIELEKMKVQQARDAEKLKKLLADQKWMTITAPADGVVYYGKCVRGKWSGASAVAEKLRPGSSVTANSVLMTIVSPRPALVRSAVAEKDLHWIKKGLRATVTPTAFADQRLAGNVASVESIPGVDGKYSAVFGVHLSDESAAVVPGMTCKIKAIPYQKRRVLTVPVKAMKTDKLDDTKHYIQRVGKDGKPHKTLITIGQKSDEKVEVLDGLVAGDKVLAEYKE